ncbi:hypothetical protein DPMN_141291 [Dreissena polymorpha]|uniref:Uncharacterized protein n=1 Tax=Dreissena polymorpha TaxID=45954 RepID=A0A9D4GD55_DREPO|nr:hypothetical protein DPMN_141291 [Dreissena polymorpha]
MALFKNFLKTQSTNADVTEMKFGGTDQLTDALWYLLANMKITFGLVSHVSLTGMNLFACF